MRKIICLMALIITTANAAQAQVVFSTGETLKERQYLPYDSLTNIVPSCYKYDSGEYGYLLGQEMYYLGLHPKRGLAGEAVQLKEGDQWKEYPMEEVVRKCLKLVQTNYLGLYFTTPELPDTLFISSSNPDEDFVVKGHLEKATEMLVGKELVYNVIYGSGNKVFKDYETHRGWSQTRRKEGKADYVKDGSLWKCIGVEIDAVNYAKSAYSLDRQYENPYSTWDCPNTCRVTLVLESPQYGRALFNLSQAGTLFTKFNAKYESWKPILRLR